jgi:hypothetical protein
MNEAEFFATLQGEDEEEEELRLDKTELEEEDEAAMQKAEYEGFMRIEKC